jgi:hypothetical protein
MKGVAMKRLTWRDGAATILVGVGVALYLIWLSGSELIGPRVLAATIFGLGLAASVVAVVYGVGAGLLRAPRLYLAVSSLIGLVALVAGIIAITSVNEAMLATLVVTTVVLWLMATIRHAAPDMVQQDQPPTVTPTLSRV